MPAARPILFSAPMIRALLDGRKTQTRRIMKPQPQRNVDGWDWGWPIPGKGVTPGTKTLWRDDNNPGSATAHFYSPYGRPGDLLWVRESFVRGFNCDDSGFLITEDKDGNELPLKTWYRADENKHLQWADEDGHLEDRVPWKPSIHMPRTASRITLEITDVRIERPQYISPEDAEAEGINRITHGRNGDYFHFQRTDTHPQNWIHAEDAYRELWQLINGAGSWSADPWIWALTFKVQQCNVDALLMQKAA
jgi:hypothetical protein